MWDIINVPLGWVLKMCSLLVGNNYLFAIFLFAVLFEILLLPFAIKQQKNSIKQARLRPKEMAIRKKYSGRTDKPTQQKMTMEIQELYQKEGYNPMSGCLPLLIQFPLLIALYNIVINPLKYICGLGEGAIQDIGTIVGQSAGKETMVLLKPIREYGAAAFSEVEGFSQSTFNSLPNLDFFGLDLSLVPFNYFSFDKAFTFPGIVLIMIPVATFLAYFFSMKVTRKLMYQPAADNQAQMGCSNKFMDIVMPLFSVFIAFGVPAALGLYWIFKSLIGVVKQFIISKAMPIPQFTEEDYKAAEKEIGAQTEKNSKVAKSGRVVRSLHHIDDEDFEDTAEAARRRKEALEAQEAADKEAKQAGAKKKKGLIEGATLKEDGRSNDKAETASDEKEDN